MHNPHSHRPVRLHDHQDRIQVHVREIRKKTFATETSHRLKESPSNAGVPGIACFWRCPAKSLTETLQIARNRDYTF